MFLPLHDANRLRHIDLHYTTLGLIAANIIVYVIMLGASDQTFISLALIPATVGTSGLRPDELSLVPEWATFVTYTFLHGDFWHIAGNMLFLWVFGDNVEDAMGHIRFLAFYLLCGAAAGLLHVLAMPDSVAPLVGASGSVAGVIGAYLMLHPRVKVWILVLMRVPLRVPAMWALGAWILLQVGSVIFADDGHVGWWAHIGGFLTGALLVVILRRPGVPLFDRNLGTAEG